MSRPTSSFRVHMQLFVGLGFVVFAIAYSLVIVCTGRGS